MQPFHRIHLYRVRNITGFIVNGAAVKEIVFLLQVNVQADVIPMWMALEPMWKLPQIRNGLL
jgi:hypothetical protein